MSTPSSTIKALLEDSDIRQEVLEDAQRFSDLLLLMISIYYTPRERGHEFVTAFENRLSFNDRIELFRTLPFKPRPKAFEYLKTVKAVQRVRNYIAHPNVIVGKKTLDGVQEIYFLFDDFPKSYRAAVRKANRQIYKIGGLKETMRFHLRSNNA